MDIPSTVQRSLSHYCVSGTVWCIPWQLSVKSGIIINTIQAINEYKNLDPISLLQWFSDVSLRQTVAQIPSFRW